MRSVFKAISLRAGTTWAVILTTQEGASHEINGFDSVFQARAWVEGETGQRLCAVDSAP